MRQEAEPATAEIDEVAPGILRMQLPLRMPGLGHVNCYALEDEKGFTLVDPGMPGPQAWKILIERFKFTADQAFQALARVSMARNEKVRDVAERFVRTGELPDV